MTAHENRLLAAKGFVDPESLRTFARYDSPFGLHPDRTLIPGVEISSGSLGHGLPLAVGMALGLRARGNDEPQVFCLVGDAELDEGSVWEAIAEPSMAGLDNVIWVVDLNRQSLDRIIPGMRGGVWGDMFAANGWTVVNAKYGRRLEAAFNMPHGELLRDAIDGMPNELYQRLLRVSPEELREWLPRAST
ncbi:MAG: pyruvate dehydrogenase, partial [Planctomycetes bacterium]|nr:pyruvate dehydrogenase [Planctomycetota bacterium]